MIIKTYRDFSVEYVDMEELPKRLNGNGFVIAKVTGENISRIGWLLENGFRFHERYLEYQISLNKLDSKLLKLVRADVRNDNTIDDEMFELAKKAFVRDRRFHLTLEYDSELAGEIIYRYLKELAEEECFVYKCFHKERLIGFTIIKKCQKGCEIVLGAVDPDFQKKGAAFNLYVFMAESLRKSGYEYLVGSISSSNTASLNLHLMLGATFTGIWEQYIKRI